MLPEGHKPVCRACYNGECDDCADNRIPQSDLDIMFMKCECSCRDVQQVDSKPAKV